MAKQTLVKIGQTTLSSPAYRHSVENFVKLAEAGRPWRVYPMSVFYEMTPIGEWYVESAEVAKAEELAFKRTYTRIQEINWDANGIGETASLTEKQIAELQNQLNSKYPLQVRPKTHRILYLFELFERETPLDIPEILKENFRRDYKK